tara:strand:+ start:411 stop:797 length:387 start_codon:yes stop_codon:yes gene_type:complete
MKNIKNKSNFISILIMFNIFLVGICFFVIGKNLNQNKLVLENFKSSINKTNNQLAKIIDDVNFSNKEISALNLKVSVLNEELNIFNKSISKNEDDLKQLQLKMKDVMIDLNKVLDMTELQNRKLYVSE